MKSILKLDSKKMSQFLMDILFTLSWGRSSLLPMRHSRQITFINVRLCKCWPWDQREVVDPSIFHRIFPDFFLIIALCSYSNLTKHEISQLLTLLICFNFILKVLNIVTYFVSLHGEHICECYHGFIFISPAKRMVWYPNYQYTRELQSFE